MQSSTPTRLRSPVILYFLLLVVPGILLTTGACAPGQAKPVPEPDSRRGIAQGKLIGARGSAGSFLWAGIPYAAPPVGDLRWKAPRPAPAWKSVRRALEFGSLCYQYGSALGVKEKHLFGKLIGTEDCLYLNVWTPGFKTGEVPTGVNRLPVMFWIHGGGNTLGHGGFYDGGYLAARFNMVVITINYRLGPMGWFSHPALASRGPKGQTARINPKDRPFLAQDASGNFGLLDIIAALRWTKQNISAFGGNPDRVTVFGESAGAVNTISLLISPLARGLFHGAIAQSGSTRAFSLDQARNLRNDGGHKNSAREIVARLAPPAIRSKDDGELASYLRKKSAPEVFAAYLHGEPGEISNRPRNMIAMPTVIRDGFTLPETHARELLANPSSRANVPVILGTNRDEMRLFSFGDGHLVKRRLSVFYSVQDEDFYRLYNDYISKMWQIKGLVEPANALVAGGAKVFAYRFDWDEEDNFLFNDFSLILGAAHGLEIPFLFGYFDMAPSYTYIFSDKSLPSRRRLSNEMMSYWAEFAYNGDPGNGRGGVNTVHWKGWSPRTNDFIIFDSVRDRGIQMSAGTGAEKELLSQLKAETKLDPARRCQMATLFFKKTRRFFEPTLDWRTMLRKHFPKNCSPDRS